MKKILLALAAASTVAVSAVPAAAAPGVNINQQQAQLETRIQRSLRNHVISAREAAGLRADLRQIERLEQRYRRAGLTQWERRDLERRLDQLARQIRTERRDRDGRQDRDYGHGYGRR